MRFTCPICSGALEERAGVAVCDKQHSYDKSKYGYYNLLVGNAGGVHGDNKEMVLARRAFLDMGYYEPLRDAVSALVLEHTARCGAVLDAGCGEGYYTSRIESAFAARDGESCVCAFDISKDAVRAMKKRCPSVEGAVCGSYPIPAADGTFDTVVNMFSPNAKEEFFRVLKSGGTYLMVIPAAEHLFELKSVVYDTPYKNEVEDTRLDGFTLLSSTPLTYKASLTSGEAISSLFYMTPYAYRTRPSDRERIRALTSLEVTLDFLILVYSKCQ
jgi:23S rRNA (guanine745-N1)-methyltransferase